VADIDQVRAAVRLVLDEFHVGELAEIARELIAETVSSGSYCDDPTLACGCFVCRAIRVLVAVEGPGRCVICGCDEEHACTVVDLFRNRSCGWADDSRRICDRHPAEDVATARLVLAQEALRG
jgi:hypothetical protein